MKTAWSHLPNAAHIDCVLASVKAHPDSWAAVGYAARSAAWSAVWDAARGAVRPAAYNAAYNAAYDAAYDAARGAARGAAQDAAWDAAWDAARDAARGAAYDMAWGSIAALIAWDDCAKYLNMTSDKLKVWTALSNDPACILLLPAVTAFEKINELEMV